MRAVLLDREQLFIFLLQGTYWRHILKIVDVAYRPPIL
jgi:hypothetical protein